MLARIRRMFATATHPLRKLWNWAMKPDGLRKRLKRFRALQRWAKQKKDNQPDGSPEKAKWREIFRAYRRKARRLLKRIREQAGSGGGGSTGCGGPSWNEWGGSASIVQDEVIPIARARGIGVSSTKRDWPGNEGSDHDVGQTLSYAADLPTFSGAGLAEAIGKHFGAPFRPVGTYSGYNVARCGRVFRQQTLWAVSGHFDHVHHGSRRVGFLRRAALRAVPGYADYFDRQTADEVVCSKIVREQA